MLSFGDFSVENHSELRGSNMFKKGDKLDIFDDEYTEQWLVCTIIECKDETIKIAYDGYDDQYAEWIPIISDRVAPYNTHTLNYEELELPPNLSFGHPPPLYWHDHYHNKGYVLISSIATDKYIYAFDISTKIFIKFCQYPSSSENDDELEANIDFDPIWHSAVIDQHNDKLYILSGINSDFAVLDLFTKKWSFDESIKENIPLIVLSKSVCIQDLNEFHVFGDGNFETHFKWNKNNFLKPIEILDGIENNKIFRDSAFIYSRKTERMYMFGGWNGIFLDCICYEDIWYCDVKKGVYNDYQWKLSSLKMPQKQKHFATVLAFECLVFVFYIRNDLDKSIWCLDLIQKKWYKSHKLFPCNYGTADAVKTKDNHIHFICCDWSNAPYHIRLNLYDIVPLELVNEYEKKWRPVIYGYVKEIQMMDDMLRDVIVPISLIEMILKFYPLFGF